MSRNAKPGSPKKGDAPSPKARRKQMIVGMVMGAVMGLVISFFTQFWLYLPAGIVFGFGVGVVMKPPAE